MAITLVAITSVFNAGLIVQPDEIFSAEDDFAKRLIESGSAKVHEIKIENTQQLDNPPETLEEKLDKLTVETLKARVNTYNDAIDAGEFTGEKIELANNAKKAEIIAALVKAETVDSNE